MELSRFLFVLVNLHSELPLRMKNFIIPLRIRFNFDAFLTDSQFAMLFSTLIVIWPPKLRCTGSFSLHLKRLSHVM